MNAGPSPIEIPAPERRSSSPRRARNRASEIAVEELHTSKANQGCERKAKIFILADSRLLQEALARLLLAAGDFEVAEANWAPSFEVEALTEGTVDILLMSSRCSLAEDLPLLRQVRQKAPGVQILLLGGVDDETQFLQYVRAGVRGYLPPDASAEDILVATRAVRQGQAVCSGSLCALLFRYLEREAASMPSAILHQRVGLTRREQQLIPLIARGLTNKEIANHFCLSEQTVKNHLYRMKHKVGADGRLGIVQVCRTQGFLI